MVGWHQCMRCGLVENSLDWKQRGRRTACPGDVWTILVQADMMPGPGMAPDMRRHGWVLVPSENAAAILGRQRSKR